MVAGGRKNHVIMILLPVSRIEKISQAVDMGYALDYSSAYGKTQSPFKVLGKFRGRRLFRASNPHEQQQ